MLQRFIFIILTASLFATGYMIVEAQQQQQPIDSPLFHQKGADNEDRAWGIEERMAKMRIQKDKKDHEELIARGLELNEIIGQLEKSFEASGQLSQEDFSKLATAEKLAKKIRNDLGGSNDGDEEELPDVDKKMSTLADAVKLIQSKSEKLIGELKKSTRFTISVPAIQSTNAVIRLAKFLRVRN